MENSQGRSDKELIEDLRQVVKKYREQCYHCFEGITCEVCVLAEPLLEPQPMEEKC